MNARLRFAMQHPRRAITSIARRLFGIRHRVSIASVKSQCLLHNYKFMEPASNFVIHQPRVFGKTLAPYSTDVSCQLLESYVAHLQDVVAISQSTLIKTEKNKAIYDELASLSNKLRYGLRFSGMSINQTTQVAKFTTWHRSHNIDQAIHLMHEASYNYFHWLIECLPRLAMIDTFPEYDSWPILIDKKLPSQFIDALQIFNNKNRSLIQIDPLERVNVRDLAFASCQSVIRDNYHNMVDPSQDIILSPNDIKTIRSKVCTAIAPDNDGPKKIYLSRHGALQRVILNEMQIENFLKQRGFAIINPAHLTFAQQVSLLSQAQVVVSPTGAGLTNMIFASVNCKIVCLTSSNIRSNLYFFNTIAQVLGLNFSYVIGPDSTAGAAKVHNDYMIDIDLLKYALDE